MLKVGSTTSTILVLLSTTKISISTNSWEAPVKLGPQDLSNFEGTYLLNEASTNVESGWHHHNKWSVS